MAGMACGAVADGAVGVGPAHAVTLFAAAGHGRAAFELNEGMRRPARATGLIGFREIHLLGAQALFPINSSPRRSGMTAMEKLLINALVAAAAIPGGQLGRDDEAMMIFLLLAGGRLMAFKAVHSFAGVGAHLVLVYYGILRAGVALGTFSSGANEVGTGLLGLYFRPGAVNEECRQYQSEGNYYCDEYRTKRHCVLLANLPGMRAHC